MTSDAAWKWMVKGLGGIVTMLLNHHSDPDSGGCPNEWLADLEKQIERLTQVAREQREKACTPSGTRSV